MSKSKFIITFISLLLAGAMILIYSFCMGDLISDATAHKTVKLLEENKLLEYQSIISDKTPEAGLWEALIYYDIENPEIVYAQAVLETGNFKSAICRQNNNLFGLYNSHTKTYYKFKHWTESVEFYKNYIQKKYNPKDDYYAYLQKMGYAEDPEYVNKLKKIVESNDSLKIK